MEKSFCSVFKWGPDIDSSDSSSPTIYRMKNSSFFSFSLWKVVIPHIIKVKNAYGVYYNPILFQWNSYGYSIKSCSNSLPRKEHALWLVPPPGNLPELHVAGKTKLTTSLHVEGSQIHTESSSGLLEKVVGYLKLRILWANISLSGNNTKN